MSLEREAITNITLALAGAIIILALVICFAKIKYFPILMSYIKTGCI
jgi:hypothetical protein